MADNSPPPGFTDSDPNAPPPGFADAPAPTSAMRRPVPAAPVAATAAPRPQPGPVPQKPPPAAGPKPNPNGHSWLDQAFGALDAPFILGNASFRGKTPEEHRKNIVNALTQFVHDPAAANEEYGLGQKKQIQAEKAQGDPTSQFWLDHPRTTGVVAGAAEFVNPANELIGGPISDSLKYAPSVSKGISYISRTKPGLFLLHAAEQLTSPFKGISPAGGQAGKRAIQSMLVNMANAPAQAQHAAHMIFRGLTDSEAEDVIHIRQSAHPDAAIAATSKAAVKTTDPDRLRILQQRADTFGRYVDELDKKQVAQGTLSQRTVNENPVHFGMAGIADTNKLTAGQKAWRDKQGGTRFGGSTIAREGTESTKAKNATLAELQANAKGGIKQDFNVVRQAEQNFTHAIRNAKAEEGIKHLPPELIKQNHAHTPGLPPKDGAGQDMWHWKDLEADSKYAPLAQIFEFSPTLRHAYMSTSLIDFLAKNGTKIYDDRKLMENFEKGSWQRIGLSAFDKLDNAARFSILANPFYHPILNLPYNAIATAGPGYVHRAMLLAGQSLIATLPGGSKLADAFVKKFYDYPQAYAKAVAAGAQAESKYGGMDATARISKAWDSLNTPEKVMRMGDNIAQWMQRSALGRYGEEAFSTDLFKYLTEVKKHAPQEAAGLVREALGNYQNVSKGSWQQHAGFFYPWLKGNLMLWARTLLKHPSAVGSVQRGDRVNNSIVDDPEEQKPNGRAKDFEYTMSNYDGQKGQYGRGMSMLPMRDLNKLSDIAGEHGIKGAGNAIEGLVTSHLKPGFGTLADAAITHLQPPADPRNPSNFHTILDESQGVPLTEQIQQGAGYLAGRFVPMPGVAFPARDAIRTGVMPSAGDLAKEALTGWSSHADYDQKAQKQMAILRKKFTKNVAKATHMAGPGKEKALERAHKSYEKGMTLLQKRAARLRNPNTAPIPDVNEPPPGFSAPSDDNAPPPGFQ